MKLFIRISLVSLFLFANSAHAFFFIIPTGKISDLLTGAEGDNCVTNATKIGDKIILAGGKVGEVKSLSGTSTRCTNQALPIRALIEPVEMPVVETAYTYNPMPGYESTPLNDANRFNRAVAIGAQKDTKSGYSIFSIQKHTITNINVSAEQKKGSMITQMLEPIQGPIKPIIINGIPALQFEIEGAYKDGSDGKFLVTLFDGQDEVIFVTLYTKIENYPTKKPEFMALLNSSGGIIPAAKTEIVVEGSIEDRTRKCTQMGLTEKTKKFNDCLSMFAK
jgi:hypothetical protein